MIKNVLIFVLCLFFISSSYATSIKYFPGIKFQSSAYGIWYDKGNIELFLSSTKTPNVYLFGAHKKHKVNGWLTLLTGLSGQKGPNETPLTIGLGAQGDWDFFGMQIKAPVLFSYYRNSAMTIDYGLEIPYRAWLLGFRGIYWLINNQTGVNELYWQVGIDL
ncbi:MAG: hypothetical protein ABIE84_02285 [bacterium]